MTRDEPEAKFRGNAALAVSGEQASRLIRIVTGLGEHARMTALAEALTG